METTPYQRLEQFWQSKGMKNASAFAEAIGKKPATVSALKVRSSQPSSALMKAITQAFPDLNAEFVLFGRGSMLKGGRSLAPAEQYPPAFAGVAEPAPTYATPAPGLGDREVFKILEKLKADHREELKALAAEHKLNMRQLWESKDAELQRAGVMYATLERSEEYFRSRCHWLEGKLGMRAYSPEELKAFEAQEARAESQESAGPAMTWKPGVIGYTRERYMAPQGADTEDASPLRVSFRRQGDEAVVVAEEAEALQDAA